MTVAYVCAACGAIYNRPLPRSCTSLEAAGGCCGGDLYLDTDGLTREEEIAVYNSMVEVQARRRAQARPVRARKISKKSGSRRR